MGRLNPATGLWKKKPKGCNAKKTNKQTNIIFTYGSPYYARVHSGCEFRWFCVRFSVLKPITLRILLCFPSVFLSPSQHVKSDVTDMVNVL